MLRAGALEATLSPTEGGRLATLRDLSGTAPRDLVVPLRAWPAEPRRWSKGGAYPLIPYSNRIADGCLRHAGRLWSVRSHPDATPHSLHGTAHLREWEVEAHTSTRAVLTLAAEPDGDWPWPYTARQSFELTPEALRIELSIENRGLEAFPVGLGWHPYLAWSPNAEIHHDARWRWLYDKDYVATGETAPADTAGSRTSYFADWTGLDVRHADGHSVHVTASPALSHLVLHRPDDDAYLCVEPVSHVANGFNLAAEGVVGTGTRLLGAGASFSAWVELGPGRRDPGPTAGRESEP
ncbi:aldose epimerase family protein [Bosea sp. MMO-172]|uniref:aldose epimerase family protein n=1 Tax=Bosea sp. MMO-172 TaxID=3127885 RepID=UPI003017973E